MGSTQRGRWVGLMAGLAVGALTLSACGGSNGGGGDGGSTVGELDPDLATAGMSTEGIVDGGEVKILITQGIFSLDPARMQTPNFGSQGGFLQAIYDTLFYVDSDTNTVMGSIGDTLEATDETCGAWDMTLKDGVEFTDGTPLDAAAVEAHWLRLQDPEVASPQATKLEGVTFDVVDDLSMTITLPEANCDFDRTISTGLGFVPSPTAVEAAGEDYGEDPVGAGPFTFDSWNRSANELNLVKNDSFHTEGEPHLDKLSFITASNTATVVDSLIAGEYQLADNGWTPTAVDDALAGDLGVQLRRPNGGFSLQFNQQKPPFDKVCARRAFAHALDPEAITAAMSQSELMSAPLKTLFTEDSEFYAEDIAFPGYDLEAAAEEVQECEDQDNPLTFSITASPGTDQTTAEYLASRLNEVEGFDVTVDVITYEEAYTTIFQNRDFNINAYPGGQRFYDPAPLFVDWLHSAGATNITSYASDEMDELIQKAQTTPGEEERIAAWQDVARLWVEDVPTYAYMENRQYFLFDKDLAGIYPVNDAQNLLLTQSLGYTTLD
ncbi:ABC transporter substrate-binding protein [Citricoccus sp. NPDC055426]|uniref:ABC transporter substrate-binding protein n=1 Tax=Citricoccus sp. NPDC055426 TaxID=3155536 RepID=UPI00343B92C9